jgi:hypothetical protein
MNFTGIVPRYKLLLYPFLFFLILFCFALYVRSKIIQKIVLIAVSVILLLASYGIWMEKSIAFKYIEIERSLEYRAVMQRDIQLAKEVARRFSGFTVSAPPVLAQIFAFPELGYVRKPFPVIIYGMPCTLAGITVFDGLDSIDISRTLWVGYEDDLAIEVKDFLSYPVDRRDVLVGEVIYGKDKAVLFFGGFAVAKVRFLVFNSQRRINFGAGPGHK